jgi:hypothetical protein
MNQKDWECECHGWHEGVIRLDRGENQRCVEFLEHKFLQLVDGNMDDSQIISIII